MKNYKTGDSLTIPTDPVSPGRFAGQTVTVESVTPYGVVVRTQTGETFPVSNHDLQAAEPSADRPWPSAEFYRASLELFISKVEGSLHDPEWLATLCKSQREACNLPKS